MSWTVEQAVALAPDEAARQAARGLAVPARWSSLGRDARALWGEIKGGGAQTYRVEVDLDGPSVRCSCPSRRQPCKHGIALALVLAQHPEAVAASSPPPGVVEWLAGRDERAARAEARRAAAATAAGDEPARRAHEEARLRRAAERVAKVDAGVAELRLWLRDLVRGGIAATPQLPLSTWSQTAARMVDAQALGLARRVSELSWACHSGPGWPLRMADRIGVLHLLLEAWTRVDALPPDLAAEVRTWVGFSQSRDEVLATGPRHRDRWVVAGRRVTEDERLQTQRTWLWALGSGRPALDLEFAAPREHFERSLPVGAVVDAEVAFGPGTLGYRCVVAGGVEVVDDATRPAACAVGEAVELFTRAVARSPWVDSVPVLLGGVVPVAAEPMVLADPSGAALRVDRRFDGAAVLLALSGGRPVRTFVEVSAEGALPLTAWSAEGRPVPVAP